MKYGIWCQYNDPILSDCWALPGLVKDIIKFGDVSFKDKDGKFYTNDINMAYQYMEYLISYHNEPKWVFEVKEK